MSRARRAAVARPLAAQSHRPGRVRASRTRCRSVRFSSPTEQSFAAQDDVRRGVRQVDAAVLRRRRPGRVCRAASSSSSASSRFKKTGQRAFVNNGQTFPLGIPLTATITPIEFSAGYRFGACSMSALHSLCGGGIGRYSYRGRVGLRGGRRQRGRPSRRAIWPSAAWRFRVHQAGSASPWTRNTPTSPASSGRAACRRRPARRTWAASPRVQGPRRPLIAIGAMIEEG